LQSPVGALGIEWLARELARRFLRSRIIIARMHQAGTYNVNGKKPAPGLNIGEWLGLWDSKWPSTEAVGGGASGSSSARPGIVFVGFQVGHKE
jgi:hypothetical protein